MSPPWSRPLDIDRLADGGADVDFAVALAELTGLHPQQPDVGGSVSGRVHFTRERGFAVAELALEGAAQLQCQRCLQPLQVPLHARVRLALLSSAQEAARVPEDLEPVLASGGRVSLGELITEELLLSLPLVPLHEAAQCGVAASQAPPEEGAERQRPFAQLADLLKRP
jgi:DUF177 domain-containing protein